MPIYQYACEICYKEKEVLHSLSQKPVVQCDKCNGEMKRIISVCSFILKGEGFYINDYKRTKRKPK